MSLLFFWYMYKVCTTPILLTHTDTNNFIKCKSDFDYQPGCLSGILHVDMLVLNSATKMMNVYVFICATNALTTVYLLLQSPCYKHVRKIDCPVTVIDLYSDPIDDEHDCTVINSYGES